MRRSEHRQSPPPGFGRSLVFDLTAVHKGQKNTRDEEPPTVYYLVPRESPAPGRSASAWRTVAGFGVVIGMGLGLGLILARLLLIV